MHLLDELAIRDVTLRNRIVVSPMCQYSSPDGFASDWHLVHLGSRAVGGAGLVFTEATAVSPQGRISPRDLGIWKEAHIEPLARVARFIREHGGVAGIQIAHSGRKGSTPPPWDGAGTIPESSGGWKTVAPSALPFGEGFATPAALDVPGIHAIEKDFAAAAERALRAGFQILEIHAAHGYLLHEFLSPVSNERTDAYGDSFENRIRFLCETVGEVRKVWPERLPLFVRISATDWIDRAWDIDQSVELARKIGPLGVDLIVCSSGGIAPKIEITLKPGYQVGFAQEVRLKSGVMSGAIGLITSARQADIIVRQDKADVVALAREFLRDPYWPLHVAHEAGIPIPWPVQYLRGALDDNPARKTAAMAEEAAASAAAK